ncbi:MAG: ATP-binding cassette domain-containing protein [Proteobacteria bacterium]|nr:ATP-binding cassette domain-containing protein [Pseudomonadota bacterium]
MLKVTDFSYDYGEHRAVNHISFELKKGEIVAFLGPNGAGKSTTMKAITTLLRPSAGQIEVAGFDVIKSPIQVRKNLGYLPETNPLYLDMLVCDALYSIAAQRQIPRKERKNAVQTVAKQCGISEVLNRPIEALSRGYRQRVGIAQAIIHQPDLLILDEATTGLDPNQIREIRDLIIEIGREKTVLLSTHILQEVTAIATRVIILNQGKIVCDGTPAKLLQNLADKIHKPDANIEDLFAYYTQASTHLNSNSEINSNSETNSNSEINSNSELKSDSDTNSSNASSLE